MKLLIVGDYPPPYGGVSVQVSVLRQLLTVRPGFSCRFLDIGESRHQRRPECLSARNPFDFAWKLFSHAARQYTIHLHTNGHNLKSWLVCVTCAAAGIFNRRKTVLSIGSGLAADFIQKSSRLRRVLIRTALALTGVVICRNERTKSALVSLGIPTEKMVINSGFYGVRTEDLGQVPARIEDFLQNHSPIIAALASSGPEYGIPLLIDAATRLLSIYPRLGVLLIGSGEFNNHKVDGHLLLTGELSHEVVLGVIQKVNLFVRPTYFDGDATSVREALALGVPVVASDTDFRPNGVILFRRGDVRDLTEKMGHVLRNGRIEDIPTQISDPPSLDRLLAVYARVRKIRGRREVSHNR